MIFGPPVEEITAWICHPRTAIERADHHLATAQSHTGPQYQTARELLHRRDQLLDHFNEMGRVAAQLDTIAARHRARSRSRSRSNDYGLDLSFCSRMRCTALPPRSRQFPRAALTPGASRRRCDPAWPSGSRPDPHEQAQPPSSRPGGPHSTKQSPTRAAPRRPAPDAIFRSVSNGPSRAYADPLSLGPQRFSAGAEDPTGASTRPPTRAPRMPLLPIRHRRNPRPRVVRFEA